MSKNVFPPAGNFENLPQDQIASLHEQAERLFLMGEFRFGGGGAGRYDARIKNKIRYLAGTELVTILSPASGTLEIMSGQAPPPEAAEYVTNWLDLSIESPLPTTGRWPNTYIEHNFILPRGGETAWDIEDGQAYTHNLSVKRYSMDGVLDETPEAVTGLDVPHDEPLTDDEIMEALNREEAAMQAQLHDLGRVYPDYALLMQPEWAPDYCAERIAMLAGLATRDEVGCAPNPYVRG